MWNVIANLFVKAHLDMSLAAELLDSSSSSSSSFVGMTTVPPGEFLRYDDDCFGATIQLLANRAVVTIMPLLGHGYVM